MKPLLIILLSLLPFKAMTQWQTEPIDESGDALAIYPAPNGMVYYIHQNIGYGYEDYYNEASLKYFDGYKAYNIDKLPIKLPNGFPVHLSPINDQELLIGFLTDSLKTPLIFNIETKHFSAQKNDSIYLANSIIYIANDAVYFSLAEDKSNKIFKYKNGKSQFLFRVNSPVLKILKFNKHLFISSTNGSLTAFKENGSIVKKFSSSDFKNLRSKTSENSLLIDNFKIDNGNLTINFPELNPSLQTFDNKNFIFNSDTRFDRNGNVFFDKNANAMLIHSQTLNTCESNSSVYFNKGGLECFSTDLDKNIKLAVSNDFKKTTWLSTGFGLYKLTHTNSYIHTELKGQSLRNIFPINEKEHIIGTEHGGLFKLNRLTAKTEYFLPKSKAPGPLNAIRGMFIDSENDFWIGGKKGSLKYAFDTKTYSYYPNFESSFFAELAPKVFLTQNSIFKLVIDSVNLNSKFTIETKIDREAIHKHAELDDHNLLLIADSYSLIYNKITNEISKVKNGDKESFDVYTDKEKNIWIGKRSGILSKNYWDGKNLLNKVNYNLGNPIATITESNDSTLWIGTFKGLARFNKYDGSFFYIDNAQLSHPECNRGSAFYDKEYNKLYIGSIDGLNIIELDQFNSTQTPFKVYLSAVSHSEKGSSEYKNEFDIRLDNFTIETPADKRFCKINFTTNLSTIKTNFNYFYKVNDSEWIDNGSSNEILNTYMPSGEHVYEIYAVDSYNQRSTNTLKVTVNVDYFFYQKWWFIAFLFISGLAIFLWWYNRLKSEKLILENTVAERTSELRKEKAVIEDQAKELSELVEVKNRFFANISHELRTPLTLILSPLNHVIKQKNLPPKTQQHLELMSENGNLLKERISEMLELSRFSDGKVTLSKQTVFLPELLHKNCRIFQPMADDKDIDFKIDINVPSVYISTDQYRFGKILQNLIANSLKFTPEHGEVSVSANLKNDELHISVIDNGIGMTAEVKSKVFERFYQANNEQSKANPGTGIGLTMVKEYVNLMQGKISVKSSPNKGTKFDVYIKALVSEYIELQSEFLDSDVEPIQYAPYEHKPRLLIVEDNSSLRTYLLEILKNTYAIKLAKNGKEAIEILNTNNDTEIILSDLMMPEVDGMALLEYVRKDEQLKTLPFLFLTAKYNEQTKLDAFKIGVDDYLTKPFNEDELLHRLRAVYTNYLNRINAEVILDEQVEEPNNSFTKALEILVKENLTNNEFSVNLLAEKMQISPRHFIRKVKKEIGLTPINYITEIRLNTAREQLETDPFKNLQEVAESVGIKDSRYFKKLYYQRFGTNIS